MSTLSVPAVYRFPSPQVASFKDFAWTNFGGGKISVLDGMGDVRIDLHCIGERVLVTD